MGNKKNTFKLLNQATTFYYAFCQAFKGCDRAYRDTVVRDSRKDTEKLVNLIKKASDLRGGVIVYFSKDTDAFALTHRFLQKYV